MARAPVVLALDSGAIIGAERNQRTQAVIRQWLREGARVIVPAPVLAEVLRGTNRDAPANAILRAVGNTPPLEESSARDAGRRLVGRSPTLTIDSMIVATAYASGATDILTSDADDLTAVAQGDLNVIVL